MMKYPKDVLDRLRQLSPVSEVIGRRIQIRRHGREFQALCPFHKENTPSFTINDEKGFYHCFGCGAHGDAIGFVKEYEGVNYKEAIEKLADEVGFALPKPTPEMQRQYQRERTLQEVMEAACAWYQKQLLVPNAAHVRDYVVQRGLGRDIIAGFRIGYAPEDRHALEKELLSQGFTQAQMIEVGLLIKVDGKEPYSRFRRRLMFPIADSSGDVVAFGGRVLPNEPNEKAPKYLNSPETPLFHKGKQLFNFDKVRKPARETGQLLMCEGYMDVIALAQAGIHHAVAPLGTAVTADQLQLLWSVNDEPVMCLDGDNAGERAMQRAAELSFPLLRPKKSLRFARLPAGEDPDTMVRQEGREGFLARLEKAVPLSQVLWQRLSEDYGNTPEQKAGLEAACMQRVGQIQDATVQSQYRRYFQEQLWKHGRQNRGAVQSHSGGANVLPQLPHAQDARSQCERIQKKLLCLAVVQPRLLDEADREEWLASMGWADKRIDVWRDRVLNVLIAHEGLSGAELLQRMQGEEGWAEWFAKESGFVPERLKSGEDTLYDAKPLWDKLCLTHDYVTLVQDVQQTQQAMAQEMNEQNYQRFTALSEQLRVMQQQRAQFFEDESVDAL